MKHFHPLLTALPTAQQALWPSPHPLRAPGFVIYGGTALN
jgi:hypothetical protein